MGRPATFFAILTTTALVSGCSTIDTMFPPDDQILTITPTGGARYEGQCVVRGQEPVVVKGATKQSWTLGEGVDCRILQQGPGTLVVELTAPDGRVSRSEVTSHGALIAIAQ